MNLSTDRRPRLLGEGGFILVEVLVSAVLLIAVSLAVFETLDRSDAMAGNQASRSVAGNLAQSEIERLRSLPIDDIAHLDVQTQPTVTENGVVYTIKNTSKWVTDGGDEPDCTSRKGGLDYMRVTTSVSWSSMNKISDKMKPVALTSYITPATQGNSKVNGALSVRIVDRLNNGVANLPVLLTGPATYNETTNSTGCVVFASLPANPSYTLKYQRPGWVDANGVEAVSVVAGVAAGQTRKVVAQYDEGGKTEATFVTYRSDDLGGRPSYPKQAIFTIAQRPLGDARIDLNSSVAWTDAPPATNRWNANTLWFPFNSAPYTLYPGACDRNAPPSTDPWASNVTILPGTPTNVGYVTVPSLDVTVYSGANTGTSRVSGARVKVDTGCIDDTKYYSKLTEADGKLSDPGFPYTDSATVCVSAVVSGVSRKWTQTGVPNKQLEPGKFTPYNVFLNPLKTGNPSVTTGSC